MNLNPPAKIRKALYILNIVGAPLVAYAVAKGYIGQLELNLWSGEVSATALLAGYNVETGVKK